MDQTALVDTRHPELAACLIELHCLPCIAWFSVISSSKVVVIESHEYFIKQTYRNRYCINTSQGIEVQVIPLKARHGKPTIREVKIDYSQKWLNNHIRAIESAYRKAPFYEHYSEDLMKIFSAKPAFLYDLNMDLLTICLKWLKYDINVQETVAYEKVPAAGIHDCRNLINVKKPEQYRNYFTPVPYHQVFGKSFVSNLSLLDVIMCEGPGAARIVQASAPKLNI